MPTFKKNTSAFKMKSPVKFWKNIQQMYNMGKNIGSKLGLTKKPKAKKLKRFGTGKEERSKQIQETYKKNK